MVEKMPPTLTVSESEELEFAGYLHAQLRVFNTEHSAPHAQSRQPGAVRPLRVIVKDEADQSVGGLTATLHWDWLEVEHFYLPEALRGQGLGARVLRQVEAIAWERGARHSFLTTFGFQARGFYESHGYAVVGELQGYPPGTSYYWLRKELADPQPEEET
jgi:GNAT superfamily N-acetyltransferase